MEIENKNTPIGALRDGDYWQNDRGEWIAVTLFKFDNSELPLDAPTNHRVRVEGDEFYCFHCNKRWARNDDPPSCKE